tara:strand:+ start:6666 stop:7955 length:1290 start_codon:yes stop_codon:yes gene_type:complete
MKGEADLRVSITAVAAVAILFLVNAIGYLDRQILVLVVEPLKADLGLTDTMVGLVHGAAFMVTYAVAGVFLGSLIDRRNRRNLLISCVLAWSLFTGLAGFSRSGMELFVARMGVGLGEAALVPVALSLIADYFPASQRGKALGIFMTGAYAGVGLSLVLAGSALPVLTLWSEALAGRGIEFAPWRMLMASMWVLGVCAALLLLTLKEPTRRSDAGGAAVPSLTGTGFGYWWARWRLYLPHHAGFGLLAFCSFGLHAWAPTALIREYGIAPGSVGILYGTVVVVSGTTGAFLGGWLGDRFGPVGRRTDAIYPLCTIAGAGMVGLMLFHQLPLAVAAFGIVNLGLSAALVVGLTSVADIAEAEVRGRTSALYLLFAGVLGMAAAPALIGYLSDMLAGQVRLSLVIAASSLIALTMGLAILTIIRGALTPRS